MGLGGGEVVVHDDAGTALYQVLGNDVLAGTALMGGQKVGNAENLFQLVAHAVKSFAAGISIVGAEHGGLHVIAHGVYARVGEHVHKNIAVVKAKGVEARFVHGGKAQFGRQQIQLLHDLHLVHFNGYRLAGIKLDLGHGA